MKQNPWDMAVKSYVDNRCIEDPEWCSIGYKYLVGLNDGIYDELLEDDALMDLGRDGIFNIYDAICFAVLYSSILLGDVIAHQIFVGEWPVRDECVEEQNEILSNLPKPYRACFWGGLGKAGGTQDGYLAWDESLYWYGGKIPLGQVPLEVGEYNTSKTFGYFGLDRGLARWPYQNANITVFHVVNDDAWRLDRWKYRRQRSQAALLAKLPLFENLT